MALCNNVDNTITGAGDLGNGTLTLHNEGLIEAHGSHALIIDTGTHSIVNTGILEASGGSLIVDSPVTGGGSAIIAGGVIEFTAASDNNVFFSGSDASMLALDHSQEFSDRSQDLVGRTRLILGTWAFTATTTVNYAADASNAGGVLTVSDGGDTAKIARRKTSRPSSFLPSSDGHGGTLIADAASANQVTDSVAGPTTGFKRQWHSCALTDADPSGSQTGELYAGGIGLRRKFLAWRGEFERWERFSRLGFLTGG